MRRRVVRTEVRCDLCERDISRPGAGLQAEPLDFCWRCLDKARPCESCGSLSAFPEVPATWVGNCLACWRLAMTLPRGCCKSDASVGRRLRGVLVQLNHVHYCDQLANHPDAHHCPDCGMNWGLR